MSNPFVRGIIAISIGVVMLSYVFMPILKGTNTDAWDSSETALWGVAGLAGVIGIVYGIFAIFGLA